MHTSFGTTDIYGMLSLRNAHDGAVCIGGFLLSSDELQKRIEGEVHRRIGSQYEVMIHFDTDYTVTMAKR